MTADEIRSAQIGPNRLNCIAFFLRELAAQVAESNEHLRAKQARGVGVPKKAVTSPMRVRNGKTFFVHRWATTVQASMLAEFSPAEGYKTLDELEQNESTIGLLGTDSDAKVTRKM